MLTELETPVFLSKTCVKEAVCRTTYLQLTNDSFAGDLTLCTRTSNQDHVASTFTGSCPRSVIIRRDGRQYDRS